MTIKRIQLALVHVAVTLTLLPINSTLNRVMIKELAVSATLVAVLASLPYLFSPIQVAIGTHADRHPIFGLRRTPYIALGLILCVLGALLAPQAAFILADNLPLGLLVAALAFGAWGMGYNFSAVSYLSLASELWDEQGRTRTIAVMFSLMIISIIIMAVVIGHIVEPYSPEALQRAFWVVAGVSTLLGILGLIRLEPGFDPAAAGWTERPTTRQMIGALTGNPQVRRFFVYLVVLLAAILGQDVLLEPYAAEAFNMSVQQTTRITSLWGTFMLVTLVTAGFLQRWISKRSVARVGAVLALLGFLLITISGLTGQTGVFYAGVSLLGLGTGLATTSNLSLMLDMTTQGNAGLFVGAWGVANALSRLLGSLMAGGVRDLVSMSAHSPVVGYVVVFGAMALMMAASLMLLGSIDVNAFRSEAKAQLSGSSLVEQAALMSEAGGS